MKYEETCSRGSFTLWGTGFRYDYSVCDTALSITPLRQKKAIAKLRIDQHLSKNPLGFAQNLDKTNRIQALAYSNNQTANLMDTLDISRMPSLIKMTARTSRFAYDLETNHFERFIRHFIHDFDFKCFKIKRLVNQRNVNDFYLARVQTHKDNSICVRACTLTGLTMALSDRTIRDLVTAEFGFTNSQSTQGLLNAANRLSTISQVLDKNYIPESRLKDYDSLMMRLDSMRDSFKQSA